MEMTKSYLLCGERRTGSTLLAEGLEFTGIAGTPKEYFDQNHEEYWYKQLNLTVPFEPWEYWERVKKKGTGSNGVFGMKLFWFQTDLFAGRIGAPLAFYENSHDQLADILPDLHYMYIRRRDKVRQAVSLFKAHKTRQWHSIEGQVIPPAMDLAKLPEIFSLQAIDDCMRMIRSNEACWNQYFLERGIRPLEFFYEDLIVAYEEAVRYVLEWLEIPTPPGLVIPPPRLQKQADALSEEWVERYCKSRGYRVPAA